MDVFVKRNVDILGSVRAEHNESEMVKNRMLVEYIAMMSGIELPEEDSDSLSDESIAEDITIEEVSSDEQEV